MQADLPPSCTKTYHTTALPRQQYCNTLQHLHTVLGHHEHDQQLNFAGKFEAEALGWDVVDFQQMTTQLFTASIYSFTADRKAYCLEHYLPCSLRRQEMKLPPPVHGSAEAIYQQNAAPLLIRCSAKYLKAYVREYNHIELDKRILKQLVLVGGNGSAEYVVQPCLVTSQV